MEAGAITASFELDISDFKRNIGIVRNETKDTTKKVSSFVKPAIKAFTALGGALGVSKIVASSRSAYKSYRKELNNVATVSNLTGKQLDKFGKQFLKLGGSMGKTSDLVSGAYQAFSAGAKSSAEAFNITTEAAKFARGQVTSVSAAVDILTTAMNAYGQETIDAGRASDVFATIIREGKINGDQLSSSIGNSISVYAAAGVAIEELGAGIATMTSKGKSSAETMTQMNAIIRELQKPTDSMAKLMKKLGYESGQAMLDQQGLVGTLKILNETTGKSPQKLYKLFSSIEAVQGATSLMANDAEMLTTKLDAMNNSTGASGEAFKKQLVGTEYMRESWDKLMVLMGSTTEPIYTKIGRILEAFTNSMTSGDWSQLKKTIKETIPYISAISAGFAGIGIAISSIKIGGLINKLIDGIKFFSTFGGKLSLAIGGVTLVSLAVVKANKMFNQLQETRGRYTQGMIEEAKQSKQTVKAMYQETLQGKKILEYIKKRVDEAERLGGQAKENNGIYLKGEKILNDYLKAQGIEIETRQDLNKLQGIINSRLTIQNQNLIDLNKTFGLSINTQTQYIRGLSDNFETTKKLDKQINNAISSTKTFNDETEETGDVMAKIKAETKKFAKTLTDDLLKAAQGAGDEVFGLGDGLDDARAASEKFDRQIEVQTMGLSEAETNYVKLAAKLKQMQTEYENTGEVAGTSGNQAINIIKKQIDAVEAAKDSIDKMNASAAETPGNSWVKWWADVKKAGEDALEAGAGKAEVFFSKFEVGLQKISKIATAAFSSVSSGLSAFSSLAATESQNRINALEAEKDEEIGIINEKYAEKIDAINNQNFEEQALEEYKQEEEDNLMIQRDDALFTARQEHDQKILEYNNLKDEAAVKKENARWAKQRQDIIADYNFKKEDMKKRDMDAALRQKIKDKEKQIREQKIKEAEVAKQKEILQREEKAKNDKNQILKEQFEANKAFQIAETVIRGASAAMAAYLGAVSVLPWPAGPIVGGIMAAAAGVFAGVQIAAIAQQQFVPTAATGGEVISPGLVQINEEGGEIRKLSNQELIIPAELSQQIIAGAIDNQAPKGEITFNNEFIINNADEDVESRIIEVMQEQISYATV